MVTGIGSVNGAQKMGTTAMGQLNGIPNTQTSPAPEPAKKPSDIRRSNKPIMEKRRRARINNCLNELKTLILDAMKKDPARHSKLEKADILEMTVKHLESLQRQQFVMSQATDPNVMNKFKSGFSECMNEVGRFPGIDPQLKRRLLQHLNNVINGVKSEPHQQHHLHPSSNGPVQVHILPSPPSSPKQEQVQQQQSQQPHLTQITATSNGYFLTSNTGTAVQLIPTKLTNGNIAFVLPQQIPTAAPVPMLVPIPTRTSSTGSAISSASMSREHATSPYHTPPSPANSYEAMDCKPSYHHQYQHHQHLQQLHQQQQQQQSSFQHQPDQRAYSPSTPLSLVMRKSCDVEMMQDDDKPWRPW